MMRIITGKARGVRLATLEGQNTRPTSERAKEAIFSMLQFEISGASVLDLFAGSGQMGLEALSRGASHAFFCDASKDAIAIVRTNAQKTRLLLQSDIFCGDYKFFLKSLHRKQKFDLVFLDPPYALGLIPSALSELFKNDLLAPNAKIICESASEEDIFAGEENLKDFFRILKTARYGIACVTVLEYLGENGREEQ